MGPGGATLPGVARDNEVKADTMKAVELLFLYEKQVSVTEIHDTDQSVKIL